MGWGHVAPRNFSLHSSTRAVRPLGAGGWEGRSLNWASPAMTALSTVSMSVSMRSGWVVPVRGVRVVSTGGCRAGPLYGSFGVAASHTGALRSSGRSCRLAPGGGTVHCARFRGRCACVASSGMSVCVAIGPGYAFRPCGPPRLGAGSRVGSLSRPSRAGVGGSSPRVRNKGPWVLFIRHVSSPPGDLSFGGAAPCPPIAVGSGVPGPLCSRGTLVPNPATAQAAPAPVSQRSSSGCGWGCEPLVPVCCSSGSLVTPAGLISVM